MNELINELAERANYLATEKEFPYDVDWFYLYNKKFAELLLKECMNQIQEVKDIKAGHAGPEYTQGFDDGMFVAISTIEEHFGVEE
jgi:hypothetical protein